MSTENFLFNEELAEDDIVISISSDQFPLKSALLKLGKCVVSYCLSGSADMEVNLVKHRFIESEVMVLFPSQIVEQKYISSDFAVMYFTLSPRIFQEVTFRFPPDFLSFLHYHFYYQVGREAVEEEQVRFWFIQRTFSDTENFCRKEILMNILRIYFLELYNKIRRDELTNSNFKRTRKTEIYEQFCGLVMESYQFSREVGFYASKLNISPKYLSVITQECSNTGAKQWIDDYVILELKVRLRATNDSLQQIADYFHFADVAFLSKYFKSRTGISPGEYRNRN